MMVIELWK
jgi:hypothetical protein